MTRQNENFVDTITLGKIYLHFKQRFPIDWTHRLWDIFKA